MTNRIGTVIVSFGVGIAAYWAWDLLLNKQQSPVVNQLLLGSTVSNASLPRGIRNNNPGNIKYNAANNWQGQTGKDSGGFCIFDTPANGLRAVGKLLRTYIGNGYNTIGKITQRYSPDANGLSGAYGAAVAKYTGIGTNVVLSSSDTASLAKIINAIVAVENGAKYLNYFNPATISGALAA
ncbi:MAG: hypothetical protein V4563_17220 [Pseudomonadota bacterium]